MAKARLFGTDGVRGIANDKLTIELAAKLGAAGTAVLASKKSSPRILIGMDTRVSGDMLLAALSAGICSVGGEAVQLGVMPTPALAYLVKHYGADAAVMISASHNPMEHNGIKWFSGGGTKLSDAIEDEIEAKLDEKFVKPTGAGVGRVSTIDKAHEHYCDFLRSTANGDFKGLRLALDCANGASSYFAKEVFSSLGADVSCIFNEPDGTNINKNCGSTHPEALALHVIKTGADVGVAFDGDADRLIAVDEKGGIVDGDKLMGICALDMQRRGILEKDTLVVTIMSNLGLKMGMKQAGIKTVETQVGDRYVLECMQQYGYNLGGEQSGHIIFSGHHCTGDGMLSAVQLISIIKNSGKTLSELAAQIPVYPQVLLNVELSEDGAKAAMGAGEFTDAVEDIKVKLGESGRVIARKSGTEALIRIMVEGESESEIATHAMALANVLGTKHGGKLRK